MEKDGKDAMPASLSRLEIGMMEWKMDSKDAMLASLCQLEIGRMEACGTRQKMRRSNIASILCRGTRQKIRRAKQWMAFWKLEIGVSLSQQVNAVDQGSLLNPLLLRGFGRTDYFIHIAGVKINTVSAIHF